jgi:hypothetical protein
VIERAVIISKGTVLHVSLAELKPDVGPKDTLAIMKASSFACTNWVFTYRARRLVDAGKTLE